MKSFLYATTAIIGLAVLAEPAAAQVTVTLGGAVRFNAAWIDDDETVAERTAGGLREFEFNTNTEIVIRADGKADNGLTYGAYVEIEADQGGDYGNGTAADEANIYVAGGWGRLELGDQDGVSDVYGSALSAPSGFGTGGWDGDYGFFNARNGNVSTAAGNRAWATAATGNTIANTGPKAPDSGDSTKITYYTPNFAGFQAGVSYAPDVGGDTGSGQTVFRTEGARASDWIEAGIRYSGAFAGATVNVGATADWAEGATGTEDTFAYQVGAQIGYAGFLIGGSYMNAADSGLALAGAFRDDQEIWSAGVQYTAGPIVVGATYLTGEHEGLTTSAGNDEFTVINVGATYTIAPGLTTGLEAAFFESDAGDAGDVDNEGTVVLFNTRVAF